MRIGLDHSIQVAVLRLTPQSGIPPSRLWFLWRSLLGVAACGANQMVFYCCLKLVTRCAVSEVLGRGCCEGQGQLLPVTCLEPPGKNYTEIG